MLRVGLGRLTFVLRSFVKPASGGNGSSLDFSQSSNSGLIAAIFGV